MASGIALAKVRVLLSYLEKEGIIFQKKGVRLVKTFETAEAFEHFLHHYDQRLDADKERISLIMKYGQTTECRAVFFREYFNEPHGEPCKKCDNCRGRFLSPKPVEVEKTVQQN